MGWFDVDRPGLAKLVRRKGLEFVLFELVQNSWDTNATEVHVQIEAVPGRPHVILRVQDNDPDGFKFLSHGFTLFAESVKKDDPNKRGRFNLGEKLVLAACEWAKISTTTGTVYFEGNERRVTRERLPAGSIFEGELRMTRAELEQVLAASKRLIAPVPTTINGELLPTATPLHEFEGTLMTEIADEEGYLRRSERKTTIRVFPAHEGVSYIYEMGIPVVETDFPWSVDIGQKIPLNADRDNVTPAYRKALGVLVLNEMHDRLTREEASSPIVQEALTSPDVAPEAVNSVLTQQYGENRVAFDPSDPEANQNAAANGYVVIHGGAFSKAAWNNIRSSQAATPAGQMFPTAKPYSEGGRPAKVIPESDWTDGMHAVSAFCMAMARHLMDIPITVVMEGELTQPYGANYGQRTLTFNVYRLGKKWFDLQGNFEAIFNLMLHEFGHEAALSHLDVEYHKALTRLGARATRLALKRPDLFPRG